MGSNQTSAPALPCPPWCERHYPGAPLTHTRARHAEGVGVMLCQSPGLSSPGLYLDGVRTVLGDARLLANMMQALCHPEIAALIRELAALVQDGAT